MKQRFNEKPQEFHNRCLEILNLLCSYVDTHETDDAAKRLKRTLYNNLTLKTFLSGLKEPLGTTIRCMRPSNLNEALQFVVEEDNIQYIQNRNNGKYAPRNQPTQYKRSNYHPMSHNYNKETNNHQFSKDQFPSQPISIQSNSRPPKFFTNSQVFKRPQNSYKNTNVFKPNPNRVFPAPTPMSTSTRQTYSRYQQPTYARPSTSTQRNFISEELFNTETNTVDENFSENPTNFDEINNVYDDDFDYNTDSKHANFQ